LRPARGALTRADARRYQLHIVGEVTVAVRHCLLALPGVAKADLRRVASHYQALAQCDGYLRALPGVARTAAADTAGAARAIAESGDRRAGQPGCGAPCLCTLRLCRVRRA